MLNAYDLTHELSCPLPHYAGKTAGELRKMGWKLGATIPDEATLNDTGTAFEWVRLEVTVEDKKEQ